MITAAQVKELRERTGAGMMECKKALADSDGNMERAIEVLRKSGRAKADKRAGRVAAEGVVIAQVSADGTQVILVEVNSETDFVARDVHFLEFARQVAHAALAAGVHDVNKLAALPASTGQTLEEVRQGLVAKVGENIQVRRLAYIQSPHTVGMYVHGDRIGVIVELEGGSKDLAKDIAMHVAASKPLVVTPEAVSAELIQKEKEIYLAQAASSGKPPEIVEKMVQGRLKKYLDEVSLVGQPFVKDPNITVGALLNKHRAKVMTFTRFEAGEGIEKVTEDFAEAVMSQVQGG
ncbi:MAG: translation elongation factor Ts [Gammaproteobacteria bacterium RIFCSPHIGHO2_12_FULL_41_20]|nr:MAG: translation elongation factor Ts [Gammaproteobacteria bacterium RIFCSPHIGHO2_12_FULL_41_20]